MNKLFLYSAFFLVVACTTSQSDQKNVTPSSNKQPNIILVLTDDQGFKDVGFNGSEDILTPNIDNIAKQGIVFTNGYVSHPYCSPSRAGIMTGRYQQRFGHEHNVPFAPEDDTMGTPINEVFLSHKMKEAGYNTYAIGKWHLGDHPSFLPHHRGFDKWFGFSGGHMNFWGLPQNNNRMYVQRNDTKIPASALTYLTDDFTQEALSNIKNNGDKPFFMYLSYNAPHSPDHATIEYLNKTAHIEFGKRSVYGAMIAGIDSGVGKIDALLTKMGIRDNTMIIFLSDNGGRLDAANNNPYRGHKGMLFEGGIRVPFALSWPAKLPKGKTYSEPIISLDLFATCIAAAGLESNASDALDGINLLPFLSAANGQNTERPLFWRVANGEEYAIRKGNFKLIKSAYKNKTMLFDLEQDEMEVNDIATKHPAIVAQLLKLYENWNSELESPLWIDPHLKNVKKEEANTKHIRKKSLSKKEQQYYD